MVFTSSVDLQRDARRATGIADVNSNRTQDSPLHPAPWELAVLSFTFRLNRYSRPFPSPFVHSLECPLAPKFAFLWRADRHRGAGGVGST